MTPPIKFRNAYAILKDRTSWLKATLFSTPSTASVRLSVLRTTTHSSSSPSESRIAAALSLGDSPSRASKAIHFILDRLRRSTNVHVVFKCLIVLHHVLRHGSFNLRHYLYLTAAGSRNFPNLSGFNDNTDMESRGLSSWVQWYAGVVENNFGMIRILGSSCSTATTQESKDTAAKAVSCESNSELLERMDGLVSTVEGICRVPEGGDFGRHELVFEALRLVMEDYRWWQHQLSFRIQEMGKRIYGLNWVDKDSFLDQSKRLMECRPHLRGLFLNRCKNPDFWDLIEETGRKVRGGGWMVVASEEGNREEDDWV